MISKERVIYKGEPYHLLYRYGNGQVEIKGDSLYNNSILLVYESEISSPLIQEKKNENHARKS
ncbi:hypothetical protein ACOJQI_16135 [Bacillus salacetis]|uniref:hypothetical protein n=1 Tax=Bacillus salacetis TaxID=2315464 RepID=UPI003B9FC246